VGRVDNGYVFGVSATHDKEGGRGTTVNLESVWLVVIGG